MIVLSVFGVLVVVLVEVGHTLFLPARARQALMASMQTASLSVELTVPASPKTRLKLVAGGVDERQRRRKTWEINLARYAIHPKAKLHVHISGGHHIDSWLGLATPPQPRQTGTR